MPQPTAPLLGISRVHVTLKSTITDRRTRQPVRANVLQDGVAMFHGVSYFELVLPADLRERTSVERISARRYWKRRIWMALL